MSGSHYKTRAHIDRQGRPDPAIQTRIQKEAANLLREAKIERMAQAEILADLRARYYPAEVPVPVLRDVNARRFLRVRT
jgi:hypothetical protein